MAGKRKKTALKKDVARPKQTVEQMNQLEKAAALGHLRSLLTECSNTMKLSNKEIGQCPNTGCNDTIIRCYICDTSCINFDCHLTHLCKKQVTPTQTKTTRSERKRINSENSETLCDHNIIQSKRSVECIGCGFMINICSCGKHLNLPCFCGINRKANTQTCLCGTTEHGIITQSEHNCNGLHFNTMEYKLVKNPAWTPVAYGEYRKLAFIRDRMTHTTRYIFKLQGRTNIKTPEYDLEPNKDIWLMVKEHLPWNLAMNTNNPLNNMRNDNPTHDPSRQFPQYKFTSHEQERRELRRQAIWHGLVFDGDYDLNQMLTNDLYEEEEEEQTHRQDLTFNLVPSPTSSYEENYSPESPVSPNNSIVQSSTALQPYDPTTHNL